MPSQEPENQLRFVPGEFAVFRQILFAAIIAAIAHQFPRKGESRWEITLGLFILAGPVAAYIRRIDGILIDKAENTLTVYRRWLFYRSRLIFDLADTKMSWLTEPSRSGREKILVFQDAGGQRLELRDSIAWPKATIESIEQAITDQQVKGPRSAEHS